MRLDQEWVSEGEELLLKWSCGFLFNFYTKLKFSTLLIHRFIIWSTFCRESSRLNCSERLSWLPPPWCCRSILALSRLNMSLTAEENHDKPSNWRHWSKAQSRKAEPDKRKGKKVISSHRYYHLYRQKRQYWGGKSTAGKVVRILILYIILHCYRKQYINWPNAKPSSVKAKGDVVVGDCRRFAFSFMFMRRSTCRTLKAGRTT